MSPDQLPLEAARDLEKTINDRIGEVRTEALDLSFGDDLPGVFRTS
jgi:hypothetical protein